MPDEQQNAGEQQNGQQASGEQATGKYNPSSVEDALRIIAALEKRLGERDTELDRTKTELKGLSSAQKKQLEEQGNFKKLYEDNAAEAAALKPFKERTEALEKIIRGSNDARIATIPDAKKNLVKPLIDVLPPEKLQEYLNANPDLFVKDPAPNYDAGAGGSGGKGANEPKVTDEDRRQAQVASANGYPVKPEDIAKRRLEMAAKAATNGN